MRDYKGRIARFISDADLRSKYIEIMKKISLEEGERNDLLDEKKRAD